MKRAPISNYLFLLVVCRPYFKKIFAFAYITSDQTSIDPNTTWSPSKKLSPMIITVAPPVVHPSLGLIALIHGVADGTGYPNAKANALFTTLHDNFHLSTFHFHIISIVYHIVRKINEQSYFSTNFFVYVYPRISPFYLYYTPAISAFIWNLCAGVWW